MIAVGGGTVLAMGIAMIVLPGPAIIVIPVGLVILATEFAWARRWIRSAQAILPHRLSNRLRKFNVQSVRRALVFLPRQIRRALLPKAKPFQNK